MEHLPWHDLTLVPWKSGYLVTHKPFKLISEDAFPSSIALNVVLNVEIIIEDMMENSNEC